MTDAPDLVAPLYMGDQTYHSMIPGDIARIFPMDAPGWLLSQEDDSAHSGEHLQIIDYRLAMGIYCLSSREYNAHDVALYMASNRTSENVATHVKISSNRYYYVYCYGLRETTTDTPSSGYTPGTFASPYASASGNHYHAIFPMTGRPRAILKESTYTPVKPTVTITAPVPSSRTDIHGSSVNVSWTAPNQDHVKLQVYAALPVLQNDVAGTDPTYYHGALLYEAGSQTGQTNALATTDKVARNVPLGAYGEKRIIDVTVTHDGIDATNSIFVSREKALAPSGVAIATPADRAEVVSPFTLTWEATNQDTWSMNLFALGSTTALATTSGTGDNTRTTTMTYHGSGLHLAELKVNHDGFTVRTDQLIDLNGSKPIVAFVTPTADEILGVGVTELAVTWTVQHGDYSNLRLLDDSGTEVDSVNGPGLLAHTFTGLQPDCTYTLVLAVTSDQNNSRTEIRRNFYVDS